jgi:hypothetical protein
VSYPPFSELLIYLFNLFFFHLAWHCFYHIAASHGIFKTKKTREEVWMFITPTLRRFFEMKIKFGKEKETRTDTVGS